MRTWCSPFPEMASVRQRPTPTRIPPSIARTGWVTLAILAAVLPCSLAADLLEMLNGQRMQGKLVRTTDKEVVFSVETAGTNAEMKFPLDKVHAITANGERRVIHEKSAGERPRPTHEPGDEPKGPSSGTEKPKPGKGEPEGSGGKPGKEGKDAPAEGKATTRTKAEVQQLIEKMGKTEPDWWDSTPLDYPQTLDLTWQEPPKGGWDPQKYLGPYIISVVNPNPGKWKGAVKLLHRTLDVNKDDNEKLGKSMERLGHVYGHLLGDYARAAYWWQMANKRGVGINGVDLADCYGKLGCRAMAAEVLSSLGNDRTRLGGVIKQWSDIGDLDKALALAKEKAENDMPDVAYRAAGDACRGHGRFKEALAFYQKVQEVPSAGQRAQAIDKSKQRARECIEAIRVYEALDLSKVPDGTYTGTGTGYRGPIQVQVKVQKGKIESVQVTQCKDDWFYTSLTEIPRQIIEKQGVKGVDAVTGATISSEGIINATAKALGSGMR